MRIDAVQEFIRIIQLNNIFELASQQLMLSWILIAQVYSDIFTNLQNSFNNFAESGQIWTLLIGFVLGYLFRTLTAY